MKQGSEIQRRNFRLGSGRPRSTCTDEALAEVADLVLSQEDKPQTHTAQLVKFPVKLGFLA